MNRLKYILCIILIMSNIIGVHASDHQPGEKVDAKGIVFHHIQDAYEWHITACNGHHISISLPVIVYSKDTGWHLFSSAHILHDKGQTYEGFRIATEGDYEGKVVEVDKHGNEIRPFDISITKTVLSLFINTPSPTTEGTCSDTAK